MSHAGLPGRPTDSPSIPSYFTGKPACWGCTTPPSGSHRHTTPGPYQPKAHKNNKR